MTSRRLAAALTATAVALVLGQAAPSIGADTPERDGPLSGNLTSTTTLRHAATAGCDSTNSGEVVTAPLLGSRSLSSDDLSSGQVTNSGDTNDVTTQQANFRSRLTQKVVHGSFSELSLRTGMSLLDKPAVTPSPCADFVSGNASLVEIGTVPTAGYLSIDASVDAAMTFTLIIGTSDPHQGLTMVIGGRHTTVSQRLLVPAGDLHLTVVFSSTLSAPAGLSDPTSRSGAGSAHLGFVALGTATGATTGTARSFASFPASLDCTKDEVTVALRPKIAGTGPDRLFVNGRLAKTIKVPTARKVTVAVPVGKDIKVGLVVNKGTQKLKAQRSYLQCR